MQSQSRNSICVVIFSFIFLKCFLISEREKEIIMRFIIFLILFAEEKKLSLLLMKVKAKC